MALLVFVAKAHKTNFWVSIRISYALERGNAGGNLKICLMCLKHQVIPLTATRPKNKRRKFLQQKPSHYLVGVCECFHKTAESGIFTCG